MQRKRSALWRVGLPGAALVAALALAPTAYRVFPAWAAGIFTNGVCVAGSSGISTGSPAVTYCNNPNTYPLTGNEQVPADTELSGGQSPQSEAITALQLAGYSGTLATRDNALIGGDATTNLWQRGTAGTAVTSTLTYGSADRWAIWSAANDQIKLIQDNTAADLAPGYQYAFKLQRTATTATANAQACMAQEIESVNSYQFQGQNAELSFNLHTGANFAGTINAYIITGTGVDQGLAGTNSMAYALNGGGGGSGSWTGQANASVGLLPTVAASTSNRFAVEAPIPAGATEIGVAICYTSTTATALANDYIAVSGIQLSRNPANVAYASATAGWLANVAGGVPALAFGRRAQGVETALQQRYFYSIVESVTSGAQQSAAGNGATTTTCQLYFPFPTNMRAAPTYAAIAAVTTSTFTITHVATATALVSGGLAVLGANTVNGGSLTATVASGLTTGQTCVLTSANGSGSFGWSAEL